MTTFDRLVEARPYIEAALKHANGVHSFDTIAAGILAGRFHLWPLPSGALVTEFIDYPHARHLNLFLIGGDLQEVLSMDDRLQAFARANNATVMTGSGRPGWAKALKPHGWTQQYVTMQKGVTQ